VTGISLVALILILAASGLRRTSDDQRLLVLRLGAVNRLAGPGITYVVPVLEKVLRLNLKEVAPDWHALTREELFQRAVGYISQLAPVPAPADWLPDVSRAERWSRTILAYFIVLTLSLGSAFLCGAALVLGLQWLEGEPLSGVSGLADRQLSGQSVVLMMFGFSTGVILGYRAAASLLRKLQVVPERVVREFLQGRQIKRK